MLGAAIGLNLLFHIPLLAGVLLTAADTLLLLWFQSLGIRAIEAFVLALIAVMAGCFCIEIIWAKPVRRRDADRPAAAPQSRDSCILRSASWAPP